MTQTEETSLETKVLETWSTLDYRAEKWGYERVAFDGISNHFPEDCGGKNFWIIFVEDGKTLIFAVMSLKTGRRSIFCDDGTGYDYIYTVLHHSNKKDRETQTGKFGEGLKMISATCLRHKVDISFHSKDWSVRPMMKELYLPKEEKKTFLLCQEVTEGYEAMKGSYTLIRNPPKELVEHICSFAERIIDFRKDLAPSRSLKGCHPKHKVFLPERLFAGELFVKRTKYFLDKPTYLTYQINGKAADSLLTPDRDLVLEQKLEQILKEIILNFDNIALIKPLLNHFTPECFEKDIYFSSLDQPVCPKLWQDAFHQLYGPKAILRDRNNTHINEDAQAQGYSVVKDIPYGLHTLLVSAGIKTADKALNYSPSYDLVSLENLSPEQKNVYELRHQADKIMFDRPLPAEVRIFSRAYDKHGDVTWFNGMSYFGQNQQPRIYINRRCLQTAENFLQTYAHEANHIFTKSPDACKAFEGGLTEALGKALDAAIKKPKEQ